MSQIELNEFKDWQKHKVTKALFKLLEEVRSLSEDEIKNPGIILASNGDKMVSMYLGQLKVAERILNLEYIDIQEETNNAQSDEESITS